MGQRESRLYAPKTSLSDDVSRESSADAEATNTTPISSSSKISIPAPYFFFVIIPLPRDFVPEARLSKP